MVLFKLLKISNHLSFRQTIQAIGVCQRVLRNKRRDNVVTCRLSFVQRLEKFSDSVQKFSLRYQQCFSQNYWTFSHHQLADNDLPFLAHKHKLLKNSEAPEKPVTQSGGQCTLVTNSPFEQLFTLILR